MADQATANGTRLEAPRPIIVIEPTRGFLPVDLRGLWEYRDLLYFLTWRDVKVRYKQTALGALWAVIPPVLTMLLFTAIFGHFAKMPSEGADYSVFAFTGLLPWTFFANALARASN